MDGFRSLTNTRLFMTIQGGGYRGAGQGRFRLHCQQKQQEEEGEQETEEQEGKEAAPEKWQEEQPQEQQQQGTWIVWPLYVNVMTQQRGEWMHVHDGVDVVCHCM